ncbi:MAG: RNA methyltransferase [Saprospiraceae bacterium]|nr:RNA methyltransferase [Saprospiraceae bacterium]
MNIPEKFKLQMEQLLGSECPSFIDALQSEPATSIRLNPFKQENELLLGERVPWCQNAYYLNERPVFIVDPFFHAGHYYVQEASSMFLDYLLNYLNISKDITVLDLCSAPGGKSTLLASYFSDQAFLHCHEFDSQRTAALQHNMLKWGCPNVTITQGDLKYLLRTDISYDLVLIDAPCSGEGMFRKESKALAQWSPEKIQSCQRMQKEIVQIASQLCNENALLIYSTCTYNTLENEEVLQPFIDNGSFETIEISQPFNLWQSNQHNGIFTYRCLPHRIKGEGLTISVLRKKEPNKIKPASKKFKIQDPHAFDYLKPWLIKSKEFIFSEINKNIFAKLPIHTYNSTRCLESLNVWNSGVHLGQIKGDDFIPAHGLSQANDRSPHLQEIQLDKNEALNYLKCLHFPLKLNSDDKWQLVKYRSATLGWLKSNPAGWKNYYPKHYRILNY